MPQSLNDKIEYLQELLSHSIPSGDLVEVLEKICELAICQLEKKKFGVTSRSRTSAKGASVRGRHIPYAERRKVLARDGHQCTFTSASGNRCSSRTRLEFHHDGKEFARGGESTTDNLRLRCKPHNQYEAEQSYGVEFVAQKREESRNRARAGRVKAERVAAERTRSIQVNSETAGPNETNGGRDVPTAARARSA
jgi:5-methylcytosine-specific restriction endonuclease McrA